MIYLFDSYLEASFGSLSGFRLSPVGHGPPEVTTGKVVIRYSAGRRKHCRDGGREVNQGSGSKIIGSS